MREKEEYPGKGKIFGKKGEYRGGSRIPGERGTIRERKRGISEETGI